MITSILVANRGEIARRVFATARALGLNTVAVYTDADADALHVHDADAAVRVPSYLDAAAIVAAARNAGADAIHPGYGFLSENADFARLVRDGELTWIGPPVKAIESMGSKVEAKKLMQAAGVPVLAELDPAELTEQQLPVLVKASAGGGGRGMRIVRSLAELPGALASARREAASAFGDDTVFCERYLEAGRHIEVQIFADRYGTVWALGERECSIQRRHQKLVEESPSPLVSNRDGMRERLFQAAIDATTAIDYVGAGTVEFLADETGDFHFLEMNTRLQVEHPVTELTTGLDLVELQLSTAQGEALPSAPPPSHGHAVEVRLYAEDPAAGWLPQSGTLHRFDIPGVDTCFGVPMATRGLRLDAAVHNGSVVGVHYDPMLAKVIAWAPTRDAACSRLASALTRAKIHGVTTNRDLLVNVLCHPAFRSGATDTAFFGRHGLDSLAAPLVDPAFERLSALAAALARAAVNRAEARAHYSIPTGWRNVVSQPQRKVLEGPHGRHAVDYRFGRAGELITDFVPDVELVSATPDTVILVNSGIRRKFTTTCIDRQVFVDSSLGSCAFTVIPTFVEPVEAPEPGSLLAPMPGIVIRTGATVGDILTAGQPILWLEAMKMEHMVTAPTAGELTALPAGPGCQVEVGAVLAVVAETKQEQV